MSANLATHSLKDWVIVFAGNIISGFDEESAISIEFPNDKYEVVEGADGRMTRSTNPNFLRANITITLQDSSLSNGTLQAISFLDGAIPLVDTFPVSMNNPLTGQGYGGGFAFINKQPDAEIGRNSTTREWMIVVPKLIPKETGIA